MFIFILVACLSLVTATGVVPVVRYIGIRRGLLDTPNERSSHKVPTPRIGGIGITAGVAVGFAAVIVLRSDPTLPTEWMFLLVLVAGAALGFLDDIFGVPMALRMLFYLGCAVMLAFCGAFVAQVALPGLPAFGIGHVIGLAFSSLFIAWYTNLFNFMDGIDGIAGGAAVVCFGALSIVFVHDGDVLMACLALSSVGASVGFLFYNYPPASVFMGDGGSVFLGMSAGAMSLVAVSKGALSLASAVFLMLPFVFDATFTLVRRVVQRERFWSAHRSHVYQQLCDLGLSHRAVTIIYTMAAVGFATLGLFLDGMPTMARVIVWWSSLGLFLALSLFVVLKRKRRSITGA